MHPSNTNVSIEEKNTPFPLLSPPLELHGNRSQTISSNTSSSMASWGNGGGLSQPSLKSSWVHGLEDPTSSLLCLASAQCLYGNICTCGVWSCVEKTKHKILKQNTHACISALKKEHQCLFNSYQILSWIPLTVLLNVVHGNSPWASHALLISITTTFFPLIQPRLQIVYT